MDKNEKYREIFAFSFLLTRKWEVLFNRQMEGTGLTLKQLLVLIVVENAFEKDPTIKEVARVLYTSHQNVKAMASLLEKNGFLSLYKDQEDKRVLRLSINKDKQAFWIARAQEDLDLLSSLMEDLSPEELEVFYHAMRKLEAKAAQLYHASSEQKK